MMTDLEKQLQKWLYREATSDRQNRAERIKDISFYDNITPLADKAAAGLGYGHDTPRINTIREKVDWAVGQISKVKMMTKVLSNGRSAKFARIAEWRQNQVSSHMKVCKFNREMRKVLKDAVLSGEGIALVKMTREKNGDDDFYLTRVKHRNWRNIFYDSDYREDDFRESKYLFDVSWHDCDDIIAKYKGSKKEIEAMKYSIQRDDNPDQSLAAFYQNDFYSNINSMSDNTTGDGRMKVLYGMVWWREKADGRTRGVVKYAEVVVSPSFGTLHLLTKPQMPFNMHEIPYIRVVAGRYQETGHVFSPMVRFRRGIEKNLNEIFRTMQSLAKNHTVLFSSKAIPKDVEVTSEVLEKTLSQFFNSQGGVLGLDDISEDAIKVSDNSPKLKIMGELFNNLMNANEITGTTIDQSLLGKSSNITAAVSMQEKEKHARLSLSDLIASYTDSMKTVGQMMLSIIIQWEPVMLFPPFQSEDGGSVLPDMPDGGDLENVALFYDVDPKSELQQNEQFMQIMGEMVKTMPQIAPAVMVALNEMTGAVPPATMRSMLKQAALSGVEVPEDNLTQADKDEIQQQREQVKQENDMAKKIEMGEKMSEIQFTKARTQETIAKTKLLTVEAMTQTSETAKVDEETDKIKMEAIAIKMEILNPPEEESGWTSTK